MKVELTTIDGHSEIVLREVFSGIFMETAEGNKLGVCMRDDTFEINVIPKHEKGKWHRADMSSGYIAPMKSADAFMKKQSAPLGVAGYSVEQINDIMKKARHLIQSDRLACMQKGGEAQNVLQQLLDIVTTYREAGPTKSDWCPTCGIGWHAYERERDAKIGIRTTLEEANRRIQFLEEKYVHQDVLLDAQDELEKCMDEKVCDCRTTTPANSEGDIICHLQQQIEQLSVELATTKHTLLYTQDENEALEKDLEHWKANHTNLKERLQFANQRPDLPADRIPVYANMEKRILNLQNTKELLLRSHEKMKTKLNDYKGKLTKVQEANAEMQHMLITIRKRLQAWDTPVAPTVTDVLTCIIRHIDELEATPVMLTNKIVRLDQEVQNWRDTSIQAHKDKDYYRGEIDKILALFGRDAYTCDDGTISDSPLRAKAYQLVIEQLRTYERKLARLACIATFESPEESKAISDLIQIAKLVLVTWKHNMVSPRWAMEKPLESLQIAYDILNQIQEKKNAVSHNL